MHLLLSNCMFSHQMEAHLVVSFLLNTQPHGFEELEVLPIVGPHEVGKSTLVSHVCKDERVHNHFSEILLLSGHDFTNYDLATLSKGCAVEHQNRELNSNRDRRLLVVELDVDLSEDAWNKFVVLL
jgi:ABC-type enterochelin transport system ATPase subunit